LIFTITGLGNGLVSLDLSFFSDSLDGKTAPADATAAMAKLESAVSQLGNDWATKTTDSQLPVAVN